MKAFDFLSAVCELGICNNIYSLLSKNTMVDPATFAGSGPCRVVFGRIPAPKAMAAVWGCSSDGRYLVAKIKDTPAACLQVEDDYIFIYEME